VFLQRTLFLRSGDHRWARLRPKSEFPWTRGGILEHLDDDMWKESQNMYLIGAEALPQGAS
jgi:hypothetical protein